MSASPASTPASATPKSVAPLREPVTPTAIVRLSGTVSATTLRAVRALSAVTGVTSVDTGTLTVQGRREPALGVDPSEFRRFTPTSTAASNALWAAVARGELVADYGPLQPSRADLGRRITVGGNGTRQVPLGAFAGLGLDRPGTGAVIDAVVDHARATQLGLQPTALLVAADPAVDPAALSQRLAAATGGTVTLLGQAAAQADEVTGGRGRPTTYQALYRQSAATCPGLSWTVLAAIGEIESGNGANDGPSSAGAIGPMQFLPATFAEYAVDGDGDGHADPRDPFDAVPAAARMLCHNGAGQGGPRLQSALFSYNHAQWYVDEVLALAARFRP